MSLIGTVLNPGLTAFDGCVDGSHLILVIVLPLEINITAAVLTHKHC